MIGTTPDASDAEQLAWAEGGHMYQVTGTNLEAGATYKLTVDIGDRSDRTFAGGAILLGTGSTFGTNYLTPTVVSNTTPPNGGWSTWESTFTVGSGNVGDALRIEITRAGGGAVQVDNVRLEGTNPPPPDTDGDGFVDSVDAFPGDAAEWGDEDSDGVGNNADACPNDPTETVDTDGDGACDGDDAYPSDPTEWADTDGDGVADNADACWNDPAETLDSDGDTVGDGNDAFPSNPAEWADSNGNGIGDNAEAGANTTGFAEFRYAFASAPAVFDLDFDGFADVIYIGDIGGNLWKWVVTDLGDDPINNTSSYKDVGQPNWPFRLFFRGAASTEPPPNHGSPAASPAGVHFQQFYNPPTGVLRNGKLLLGLGSGDRVNLTDFENDGSDANNNHYYVLLDDDPLETVGSLPDPITGAMTESTLATNAQLNSESCADLKANYTGYMINGRDGEKFITNSTVFMGELVTGSHLAADSSVTPCDPAGTGYVYRFGIDCGVGSYTGGTDDTNRYTSVGGGVPGDPKVTLGDMTGGASGCPNKVQVITSDGSIDNDCPGTISESGISLRSWRQRE
ncbi:MAG: hypothetical protein ACYSW1_19935 [Planctomycetota bacterium]